MGTASCCCTFQHFLPLVFFSVDLKFSVEKITTTQEHSYVLQCADLHHQHHHAPNPLLSLLFKYSVFSKFPLSKHSSQCSEGEGLD